MDESRTLGRASLASDPLDQFRAWFAAAAAAVPLAEAAALATASSRAQPSLRMVLVKSWDENGFAFFSNYRSRKGSELAVNPAAALLFHWQALGRQVRLEGPVEPVSELDSDHYFASRPRASQIGAAASEQSRTIGSREELDQRVRSLERSLQGGPVARPGWWGGYRLQPQSYEFWQHREDRLHDRIRYLRLDNGWRVDRLQP